MKQLHGRRSLRPAGWSRDRLPAWRNDGVAAASSDGGPTGGREPPTVLEFFLAINFRSPDLRK